MSISPSVPGQLSLNQLDTNISAINDQDSNFQIFLGGSCNPTTWRQKVAVPYLEMNGISFFNPQVDNWTPEVVNSERWAKQNAKILLFVIDKQTRSTVSLVESAFMAGDNKNLVLVIYPFEYNIVSLTDTSTKTSNVETRSKLMRTTNLKLNRETNESFFSKLSSIVSTTLVTSNLTHDSNTSMTATKTLSAMETQQSASAQVRSSDRAGGPLEVEEESSTITSHDRANEASGTININDEVISLHEFQELRHARYLLQNLLALRKIPMFNDIHQALEYVSCSLKVGSRGDEADRKDIARFMNGDDGESNNSELNLKSISSYPSVNRDLSIDYHPKDKNNLSDVYISFDIDDRANIETNVITIFKKKGISYNYKPVDRFTDTPTYESDSKLNQPNLSFESQRFAYCSQGVKKYLTTFDVNNPAISAIEKEICTIKSSRVLLFVITNKCRGLSIMVLASHFMALFRDNVVLCVQYLEEPCSISGENLTKAAISDYNRGRVYLSDYATKSEVPVFATIQEAIECCTLKCQQTNKS